MKNILTFLLLVVALPVWAQPKILASIKPLQLIAQAIAGDHFRVDVLLPPGATPHHYSLRPSDIEKIMEPDLVLWLGRSAEPYLWKLANRSTLADKMFDVIPAEIRGQNLEDLHFWLGPKQALAMAIEISERLKQLDPARREDFQENLRQFERQIRDFNDGLKQRYSDRLPAYLVYHDGYRYFEAAAGIKHEGVISVNPEIRPGARRVAQLRALVAQRQISCIFAEPQADIKIIELIISQHRVKVIRSDPMASTIKPDSSNYLEFLESIAEDFNQCQTPSKARTD